MNQEQLRCDCSTADYQLRGEVFVRAEASKLTLPQRRADDFGDCDRPRPLCYT